MPVAVTWSQDMLEALEAIELSPDRALDAIDDTPLATELVFGSLALAPALASADADVDAPTLTPPADAEAPPAS
jgi:hypothetical protein